MKKMYLITVLFSCVSIIACNEQSSPDGRSRSRDRDLQVQIDSLKKVITSISNQVDSLKATGK